MNFPNGTMVEVNTSVFSSLGMVVAQPGEGVESHEREDAYCVRFFQDTEPAYCGGNWYPAASVRELPIHLSAGQQRVLLAALRWMWQQENKLEDKIAKARKELE